MYIKPTRFCRPESIRVGPKTVPPLWTELLSKYKKFRDCETRFNLVRLTMH